MHLYLGILYNATDFMIFDSFAKHFPSGNMLNKCSLTSW